VLTLFAVLWGLPVLANGQSTHVWIAQHAQTHLTDGELRDFVTDPAIQTALINGAMFPDGGYPLDDDYAEIAHWEPFQNAYRDWIAETYAPPWSDEASRHVAFLLGMAAHGIADQVFDALFMERSRQEDTDGGWGDNFDLATDVVMMARVGKVEAPDHWLPAQPLIDIYRDQHAHTVTQSTLEEGQGLLRFAIGSVGLMSENPEGVTMYEADFPWAATVIDDPDQPGSPPCEGEVLALYWQSVWARVHGRAEEVDLLLRTFPEDGGYAHPTTAGIVENRISLVMAEAIRSDSLTADRIVLTHEDGEVVPTEAWLFYRDNSHVIHLAPLEDLLEDTAYTVTIGAGLETIDGRLTGGSTRFSFSTGAPPADSGQDTAPRAKRRAATGCGGCAAVSGSAPVAVVLLLIAGIVFGLFRRHLKTP